MPDTLAAPETLPTHASYHWTPVLQAEFLGHLAATGSVTLAARQVGMSPRAAHDLRHRRDGRALNIGWAAAVLIARARLEDAMIDRALFGTEESWERTTDADDGTQRVTRRRHHGQTALAMLARLDRMAETRAGTLDARLAQIAASDWANYLSLFADPDIAEAMADHLEHWFADQLAASDRLAQLVGVPSIMSEVAQISGTVSTSNDTGDAAKDDDKFSDDDDGANYHVWQDSSGEWRTDFPPPPDFDGAEEGDSSDYGYWRTLSDEEQASIDRDEAEDRHACEVRRRRCFALATPA